MQEVAGSILGQETHMPQVQNTQTQIRSIVVTDSIKMLHIKKQKQKQKHP